MSQLTPSNRERLKQVSIATVSTCLLRHVTPHGIVPVAYPGAVIVGDSEGVVVIPAALANAIAEEAWSQAQYDIFSAEQIAAGRAVIGLYPATTESRNEFERWRKANHGK